MIKNKFPFSDFVETIYTLSVFSVSDSQNLRICCLRNWTLFIWGLELRIKQSVLNYSLWYRLQVIAENIILSLNEEYIDDNQQLTLREGDEVAVIPPISGG